MFTWIYFLSNICYNILCRIIITNFLYELSPSKYFSVSFSRKEINTFEFDLKMGIFSPLWQLKDFPITYIFNCYFTLHALQRFQITLCDGRSKCNATGLFLNRFVLFLVKVHDFAPLHSSLCDNLYSFSQPLTSSMTSYPWNISCFLQRY